MIDTRSKPATAAHERVTGGSTITLLQEALARSKLRKDSHFNLFRPSVIGFDVMTSCGTVTHPGTSALA